MRFHGVTNAVVAVVLRILMFGSLVGVIMLIRRDRLRTSVNTVLHGYRFGVRRGGYNITRFSNLTLLPLPTVIPLVFVCRAHEP